MPKQFFAHKNKTIWRATVNYQRIAKNFKFFETDVCDVTLSVYPHRASLKNMPGHSGNRTYDLWNTSPKLTGKNANKSKFKASGKRLQNEYNRVEIELRVVQFWRLKSNLCLQIALPLRGRAIL